MKCPKCGFEWKDPAKVKGGQISRRILTTKQAREMVRIRERNKKVKNEKIAHRRIKKENVR